MTEAVISLSLLCVVQFFYAAYHAQKHKYWRGMYFSTFSRKHKPTTIDATESHGWKNV